MMIKEVNMRQFNQLGWIPKTVLSFVLLSAMSQSNAMSVRERYLQAHPVAKVEKSLENTPAPHKESSHHKNHHAVEKHVVETSEKPVVIKHARHHAVKEHVKPVHAKVEHRKHHHTEQSVKKDAEVTHHKTHKEVTSHKEKEAAPRVVTPKLAPTKFDSEQARNAELALQHQPLKDEAKAKVERLIQRQLKQSTKNIIIKPLILLHITSLSM
jgi:hypothetical protein